MLGKVLVALIRTYQVAISSWTPPSCRFTPTCSAYAIQAVQRHGAARGSWLTVRRLARCHPWGGYGYDPVPPVGELGATSGGDGGGGGDARDPGPNVTE